MKAVQFFGKITASLSHDLKNIFAAIKECSGLMDDILELNPNEGFKQKERFRNAINAVLQQINRGDSLATYLNKFSHLADKESDTMNLQDLLNLMLSLHERFIRVKQAHVSLIPPTSPFLVTTSAFDLLMLLSYLFQELLERVRKGSLIELRLGEKAGIPAVSMRLENGLELPFTPDFLSKAEGLAHDLGIGLMVMRGGTIELLFRGRE